MSLKMYQRVTIYPNDGTNKAFVCQFRSEKTLNRFMDNWQFYGGIRVFNYDLWDEKEDKFTGFPILTTTRKSFAKVMRYFYPERYATTK